MQDAPSYADLAVAAGISRSYAHEIVKNARKPSASLAVHIFRATGWKHSTIAPLSDEQIATLEAMYPYSPSQQAAA